MLLRLTNVAVMVALLAGFSWPQSDATKPTTYALEPVKISSAVYPSQAREQKTQGRVVAMMLVSENGDVENVQVFKADAALSQAAEETIRQWKFKPVTKDGEAVPVIAKVTFNFILDNENQQGITPEVAPATDFPQHVRVSDTVMQGLLLSKVSPVYPIAAKANHIRGVVALAMVIRKDGTVTDTQVVSGPPELAPAAVDAVRQWRYRPYQLLGRPVEIQTTAQINFR
jgi:TonB family protein